MKRKMTPNVFFDLYNSGQYGELEEFLVRSSQKNIDHLERIESHISFNPDNKETVNQAINNYYSQNNVAKVKTQVL